MVMHQHYMPIFVTRDACDMWRHSILRVQFGQLAKVSLMHILKSCASS